jgi:hypothetical protein
MKPATMKPAQLSVDSSATAVIAGEKADRDISPEDMCESDTAVVVSILVGFLNLKIDISHEISIVS